MTLFFLFMMTSLSGGDCRPVTSDRILSADLAAALPEFASLPADQMIGYAPMPGTRRVFGPDELARIARRAGIQSGGWQAVCFAWPMQAVDEQKVMEAMRVALALPSARIEIKEITPRVAPPGTVVFTRNSVVIPSNSGPDAVITWRGSVQYAERRSTAITAKVRMSVTSTHVVAATALSVGQPIAADQVREEPSDDLPLRTGLAQSIGEVAGRLPRRTIAAGAPILKSDLSEPLDVAKGDRVSIEVKSNAARLSLEAVAQSSGRVGDTIQVRNLESGRQFAAKVLAKGRALVVPKGTNP